MTAFLKSICLAALLCAGTAYAQSSQSSQNPSDNPDNPHSTKAKDKQGTDTSAADTKQQTQSAESANPHSTDYNGSQKPSGNAADQMQKADAENPDAVNYKHRKQGETSANASDSMSGSPDMDHEQMAAMDKDMMKNATPQAVLQRLHLANQEEIKMGKLAEQNGTDRIKTYAKTLQQDHQMADDQVKQLAQKEGVTLSDTPKNPQMQQHLRHMEDRFGTLKGAQFDRAFVNMMSSQHKHLISMAQGWEQNAKDQGLKSLLDQMMPKLQQHAQMADQLKAPAAQGRSPDVR